MTIEGNALTILLAGFSLATVGSSCSQRDEDAARIMQGYGNRSLALNVTPVRDRPPILVDSKMTAEQRARINHWLRDKEPNERISVDVSALGISCSRQLTKKELQQIMMADRIDAKKAKKAMATVEAVASVCHLTDKEVQKLKATIGSTVAGVERPGPYSQVSDGVAVGQVQGVPTLAR